MAIDNIVLAPGDNAVNPFTIPGTTRKYSCAAGATISVPVFDADILRTCGWVKTAAGASGPTSGRPANPTIGTRYLDTTVGAEVAYLGPKQGWVHHATGASA